MRRNREEVPKVPKVLRVIRFMLNFISSTLVTPDFSSL